MENKTNMIKTSLSPLMKMDEIQFAYLFGSYAKGDYSQRSDIDIAVYLEKQYNNFDTKLKIHHKLEVALRKEIDLIILNSAKNFNLLENIFDDGIVIKDSRDDSRIMYELDREHEIKDYKEFRKLLHVA